jgi:phage shock protein A
VIVDPSVKIGIERRLGDAENQLHAVKQEIAKLQGEERALQGDEKGMKDHYVCFREWTGIQ